MPYLEPADLKTHIYAEDVDVITREDEDIVPACIANAVSEAKGYLGAYDLLKLFGNADTEAEIIDSHLRRIIKDIACWHLCTLANPNVNIELFRTRYEDAKEWLKQVQKGMIDPEGWAYKSDDPDTDVIEGSNIQSNSNPKQNHHF